MQSSFSVKCLISLMVEKKQGADDSYIEDKQGFISGHEWGACWLQQECRENTWCNTLYVKRKDFIPSIYNLRKCLSFQ